MGSLYALLASYSYNCDGTSVRRATCEAASPSEREAPARSVRLRDGTRHSAVGSRHAGRALRPCAPVACHIRAGMRSARDAKECDESLFCRVGSIIPRGAPRISRAYPGWKVSSFLVKPLVLSSKSERNGSKLDEASRRFYRRRRTRGRGEDAPRAVSDRIDPSFITKPCSPRC